uniref:J domain-containing protein n=1 Tax=Rhabditophanes sp. KR3021 TaxID=114890 RepID=A0AC35U000_9BILA
MSSGLIAGALAVAAVGYAGKFILKNQRAIKKTVETLPGASDAFSKYYKGGFDSKMTRREAAAILGVNMTTKPNLVKAAHKRIMIANHPDRGGSPYIAAKVNEAKDLLESKTSN